MAAVKTRAVDGTFSMENASFSPFLHSAVEKPENESVRSLWTPLLDD